MTRGIHISRRCARCGTVAEHTASEGLCPRCLISDLLAPEYTAEVEDTCTASTEARVLRYFGDYEFVEELSRGGMGEVFKARQVSLNRFVAVKIIGSRGSRYSKTLEKRFRAEAEAAARLQHPNIIPIYEFGAYGGEYFLSMKLIENARSVLDLNLPRRDAVTRLIAVANAIHYAHQHGVLHRDIKPGNILVDTEGTPWLADFGLAKLITGSANLTRTQEMLGTPAYMAPEQVRGAHSLTTAVDIYGFGATLYECLTGRPPFEAESVPELLRKILEEEPAAISHPAADRDLETICLKCLEKDADRRYVSAAALAQDLELWRQGKPISARPVTNIERIGKWARRKPALAALLLTAALAAAIILVGGSWLNWRLALKNQQIVAQVIRFHIDSGSRLAQESDPARAMLYFTEALRLAEVNHKQDEIEMLRLRLDSLLRSAPRLLQLWVHPGGANTVVFSPDGTDVLSSGNDRLARVWDTRTGKPVLTLPHEAAVLDAFFSPNGRVIATLDANANVHLWDGTTGSPATGPLQTSLSSTLKAFGRRPIAFDFSSRFFACGRASSVHIIDLASRTSRELDVSRRSVNHLAFRAASDDLAIAADSAVEIWSASSLANRKLIPQPDTVRWVEFSPDGKRLLLLLRSGAARIVNPESGAVEVELPNPGSSAIWGIRFSPGGERVLTGNFANTIRVWDSATGSQLCAFDALASVDLLECGPKGDRTAAASLDGSVQFWDHRGAKLAPVLWHGGAVSSIALDPSGHRMAAASQDDSVRLWGLSRFEEQSTELDGWQHPSVCVLSRDNKLLVASAGTNTIRWYRLGEKTPRASVRTPDPVIMAEPSPDDALIGAITWAPSRVARLSVWNREGVLQFQLPHSDRRDERGGIHCFDFSPDGSRLAIGFTRHDHSGGAELLDSKTGEPLLAPLNHGGPVRCVEFDPSGNRIVTASDDGTARVWDVHTGQPLSPPLRHDCSLMAARFSPDGRSLVTACTDDTFLPRYAQVWNAADYTPRTGRLFHRDGVLDAVFSPDSRKVATAGEDATVTLWDAFTGKAFFSRQQPQKADHVAFSPDGRFLLVSCRNSSLRVIHVATGELLTDVPYGGSTAIGAFSPANNAVVFAGINGSPVFVPLAPSTLSVDQLRRNAELLSNQKLTPLGLEPLSLDKISAAWRAQFSDR